MVRALVFLAAAFLGQSAVSQQVVSRGDKTPASPAWPFGPPRTRVKLEGLLMRSDGETLSIALPDQRIIRIRLNQTTLYNRVGPSAALASFQGPSPAATCTASSAKTSTRRSIRLRKINTWG